MTLWLWLAFLVVAGTLVVVDLGLVTRRPRVVSPIEALASFSLWVLSAVGFSFMVWYVYQTNFLNLESALADAVHPRARDLDGHSAWVQWVTAYALEIALSLDNIAVAALILQHFKIPRPLIGRSLFWFTLSSLVCRLVLIVLGAYLLNQVAWMKWVFCGLLVLSMLRTLLAPDENTDFSSKWPTRLVKRLVPVSREHRGQRLFTRMNGALAITPVMLVVLVSSITDLAFAMDSVPAMFSVTRDPFLAFTASAFAILGLRSLFFALSGVIGRFRYLRVSLLFVLLTVTAKMFLASRDPMYYTLAPTLVTFAAITLIMAVGVTASAWRDRKVRSEAAAAGLRPTPLEDLTEAVEVSRRNFRKVVILMAGSVVILLGLAIAPLPGPGPIILVPIGFAILGTEFLWARRLQMRIQSQAGALAKRADRFASRSSPWLVPPVLIGLFAAVYAIAHLAPIHRPWLVWVASLGAWIPVLYWAFRTVAAARKARQRRRDTVPVGEHSTRRGGRTFRDVPPAT